MIWPLYTALLALIYLVLSIRTLRLRGRLKVAIGDGGDMLMLRAIRVHANFAEYVPLGVLLMMASELLAAPVMLVHGMGMTLLIGRVLHAVGVSKPAEVLAYRVSGMALTFICYLLAIGFVLLRTSILLRIG